MTNFHIKPKKVVSHQVSAFQKKDLLQLKKRRKTRKEEIDQYWRKKGLGRIK